MAPDDMSRRFSIFPSVLSLTSSDFPRASSPWVSFFSPLKGDNICLINDLDFLQNKISGKSDLPLLL